jgi:uncharacterized protein (TIGR00299 family) protein
MRTAYFDCFSGISGGMAVGALVDAGASVEELRAQLVRLHIPGYELAHEQVTKQGVAGTKVHVRVHPPDTQRRRLHDVETILRGSTLASHIQDRTRQIFSRLAEAEATIHHTTVDRVHFQEAGAIGSIVAITGAVIGLDLLGVQRVLASAVNVGSGFVPAAHGVLPVPNPVTAELLKGIPTYARGPDGELTTPTGAALLATLAESFGLLPHLWVERIGYGAGSKNLPHTPNLLRVFVGEDGTHGDADVITVVETNLDDMNPEWFEYAQERLFAEGVLDVFYTPIFMKKNRPATKLTVLCETGKVDAVSDIVFTHTSTFGVRIYEVRRQKLARYSQTVETPFGPISVKIGQWREQVVQISPEYESCRQAARHHDVPLQQIYRAAETQARTLLGAPHLP